MKLVGSILITLSVAEINSPFAETRDRQCEAIGGDCLNWDWYFCTAGWETGLCSGGNEIKCCKPCDRNCQVRVASTV